MGMDVLTDHQHTLLDLESEWFATVGGKETAIRQLGMTPVRYYQLLNQLVATESALSYDPVTVTRLRRIRRRREAGRQACR